MSLPLTSQGQSRKHISENKLLIFRSTIVHLRFPFSFLLMPVFLFAVSQSNQINLPQTFVAFTILHLLVFPSSNGYNSYHDNDSGSIGLIRNPLPVSKTLLHTVNFLDMLAIIVSSIFISFIFSSLVFGFIITSRAYSNRKIRLKRYPFIAFLIVSIFQGAYIYFTSTVAISGNLSFDFLLSKSNITCMIISTLFMGSVYPLTQIYQHESDKNDDIITLSYKLGYIGTFLFSSLLFMLATILLYFHFESIDQKFNFQLFIFLMTPVVIYMIYWCYKIYTNYKYANYTYTMLMNLITAVFMNLFFTILIFK